MPTLDVTAVDELARRLAAQAGVTWAGLSNHPGYQKYIWREKAREMLRAAGAEVAFPEDPERDARAPTFLA